MNKCRQVVDQFLYRICVERELDVRRTHEQVAEIQALTNLWGGGDGQGGPVTPQLQKAQRDADRFLAEAGIEQGARVVAQLFPGRTYGVVWRVEDPHTGDEFYALQSPTMLKESLTLLKRLLDKHGGRIKKGSLEPNALQKLVNRTMRAVACPTCHVGVGADCVRPSGHTLMGGGVHPRRQDKFDKYIVKEDAKLGYTRQSGSKSRQAQFNF